MHEAQLGITSGIQYKMKAFVTIAQNFRNNLEFISCDTLYSPGLQDDYVGGAQRNLRVGMSENL